jgi:hypothetical protein
LEEIRAKHKTAIFYPDPFGPRDEVLVGYGQMVDYLFVTNKGQIDEFKSLGIKKPVFCMQGCDRDMHRIVATKRRKWASEVAFIGRPVQASRIKLLQAINQSFDLKTWGGRWQAYGLRCLKTTIYPQEYARICYAAKIILGCDQTCEVEGHFSNRTWITMGCGGFLLTNYSPGLEKIFTKGEHLEWYSSPEECLALIDYYLKHEARRKEIAQNGYQFAHAHRSYDIVMDEIISRIENDPDPG